MHVMFIHPNFPAQFGHIAQHLKLQKKWDATFVTSIDTRHLNLPFNHINYRLKDNEEQPKVFYNPNSLQELMEHLFAIYRGLRGVKQIQPNLVVGHMSYGTMLYLRNLYSCPFVGYFELLPPPFWGDGLILRKEYPPPEAIRLFNATYHALTYLHLHAVDAAYTPTNFQKSTAPKELQDKIKVIFDGVDTEAFQPRETERPVEFRGITIPKDTRVLTYVSRGLESARGFDIFMKVAKRVCDQMDNVIVLIAGQERTFYGHELHHIGKDKSFKQYVLENDSYDLSRIHFLGLIPIQDLIKLYNISDLHMYLTVPYVLSWSMIQAMSSGCTIVGSATPPVQEAIDDGVHGLLADFYDVDALTEKALQVLRAPEEHKHLGQAARERVMERYEKTKCIDQLVELFRKHAGEASEQKPIENPGKPGSGGNALDDLFASLG